MKVPQWPRRPRKPAENNKDPFARNRKIVRLDADKESVLEEGRKRTMIICRIMAFVILAIIGKLFSLQIIQGNELYIRASNQISGSHTEITPRGSILDRNGEELAVSKLNKTLTVNPQAMYDAPEDWPRGKMPDRDPKKTAAEKLAPVLGLDPQKLYQYFNTPDKQFLYVKRAMEQEETEQVKQILKEEKLRGFDFKDESKRYYLNGTMAAQVLGFVGNEDKGLEGIEHSMDKVLKSQEQKQLGFFDAYGRKVAEKDFDKQRIRRMNTVELTIDARMQFCLEKSLDDAIRKTKAASAAAILMDPNTGEILGMASRPTFDPNDFENTKNSRAFRNLCVGLVYEPGSVFKPIMGSAGLMEGLITPDTPFDDKGSIKVTDRVIRNWDGSGRGKVTYTDVIKFSLNTGMAELGLKLGGERETEYARQFGFGTETGSDIPGEEAGILYNPKDMVPSDEATMAIGQGIAVTPLQMLRAICAIANGGTLVKPYIVKRVLSPTGDVLQEGHREAVRQVITPEVAEQMRGMMEKVVSEGGGKQAQIKGYKIAGKTGTAEKLSPKGGYIPGVYIASFVGFVPSDKPKYAMIIVLDSPKGAFYGSQVSAPIFKDALQQILVAEGIQPSDFKGLPTVESLKESHYARKVLKPLVPAADGSSRLPNLAGYSMREIAGALAGGQLSLVPEGTGISWKQSPAPGTILHPGDTVTVWFR